MSLSKSDPGFRFGEKINLVIWSKIITYMQNHLADRPFHLEQINRSLKIPLDDIVSVFRILRGAFQLFHHIQHEKLITGTDLFSYSADPNKIYKIKLSVEEIKIYSTFIYLWKKTKAIPTQLNADLTFRQLIENNPCLFRIEKKNGVPTEAGQYFALQYKKYTPSP